jgi:DNA-binding NtrC family response regulator
MHSVRKSILIVDDDNNFCTALSEHLKAEDVAVHIAHTGKDCLALCLNSHMDVVLLDQKLPDAEGADLCAPVLNCNSQTKIIFTTAFPSFENAVRAIRAGAFDYLAKPIELAELDLVVKHATRTLDLEKVEQFQNYRSERESEENVLVGDSASIAEVQRLIGLAAGAAAAVLITGETGSGKNMAARAIHYRGPLKHAPFIGINCAALPESLIEAELFGHEKGAFTGAAGMKKGLFEMAQGGTLFLDEIGEMPLSLQAKLLGVLDDGTYRRLGGTAMLHAQARIIAATSVDIETAIGRRKFREDLYYRLGVIKMHLPPLRNRKEDLTALCDFLIRKVSKARPIRLADGEIELLKQYSWPGNVRELRNVLERAAIVQQGEVIRPSEFLKISAPKVDRHLPDQVSMTREGSSLTLDEIEKGHILSALEANAGNYSRAARSVGISLSTLKRKLKKYRIP